MASRGNSKFCRGRSWQSWADVSDAPTFLSSSSSAKSSAKPGSWADLSEETISATDPPDASRKREAAQGQFMSLTAALHGGVAEERLWAMESIATNLQSMSMTQQGSQLVQTAMGLASRRQLEALRLQLEGIVVDCCKSPHGNHVVAKCIGAVGPEGAQFIVDELRGKALPVARDRFGCRIIQLLTERCPHEQISELIDEVLADGAPKLFRHPFSNFVAKSLLRAGPAMRRTQLAEFLMEDAPGFARHRFAKHILKIAVAQCDLADRKRLMQASQKPPEFFGEHLVETAAPESPQPTQPS